MYIYIYISLSLCVCVCSKSPVLHRRLRGALWKEMEFVSQKVSNKPKKSWSIAMQHVRTTRDVGFLSWQMQVRRLSCNLTDDGLVNLQA